MIGRYPSFDGTRIGFPNVLIAGYEKSLIWGTPYRQTGSRWQLLPSAWTGFEWWCRSANCRHEAFRVDAEI